ncbi:MAG: hypothetical protein VCB59_03550 [Gammaproteobacteria bacterium]
MSASALSAAKELVPLIEELRFDTEDNRAIAEPVVEALKKSRLGRMALLEENDGLQTPCADALDVFEVLSGAEASVGWVVWNNSLPCWYSRALDASTRNEIFADANWWYANSTRPQGKATRSSDGYQVNGRWSLVSGCEQAEWILLLCIVADESGAPIMLDEQMPELRYFFLRKGQYSIVDTWNVNGLRGTGSHDVVVEDAVVPESYVVSPDQFGTVDHPFFKLPVLCVITAGLAAQNLGVAKKCLVSAIKVCRTKISPSFSADLRDRPRSQVGVSEFSAALEAASAHLRLCTSEIWDKAASHSEIDHADMARVYSASYHAVRQSQMAVNSMYDIGSTSSIYNDSPLDRAQRDMQVMGRHICAQPMWAEDAGRVTFGLTPKVPMYEL